MNNSFTWNGSGNGNDISGIGRDAEMTLFPKSPDFDVEVFQIFIVIADSTSNWNGTVLEIGMGFPTAGPVGRE